MEPFPIVLPIRFSGGGLSMQTTTSRMNEERAFVRCLVQPKLGSQVALRITLPGKGKDDEAVDLTGSVLEIVPPGAAGKEAGFWAAYGIPAGPAEERLRSFLKERAGPSAQSVPGSRAKGAPPSARGGPSPLPAQDVSSPRAVSPGGGAGQPVQASPGNRRAFPRAPARLEVGWASPRDFLVAYSENISRGGIFIATDAPPGLRETVELLLSLPDGDEPVRTLAEVVQRVTPAEAARLGRPAGAGLQFVGGDDEFRRRLDRCIEKLLASP